MKTQENQTAEIKVSYHKGIGDFEGKKIICSSDAYQTFKVIWDDDTMDYFEEFKVLYLARDGSILGWRTISRGGVSSCLIDVKIVYSIALACNSSSIIAAHNHPSGRLIPSRQDMSLTKKLMEAGNILDIQFADHLIISRSGYYSFLDENTLLLSP